MNWYYVDCHLEIEADDADDAREKAREKYPDLHIDGAEEL